MNSDTPSDNSVEGIVRAAELEKAGMFPLAAFEAAQDINQRHFAVLTALLNSIQDEFAAKKKPTNTINHRGVEFTYTTTETEAANFYFNDGLEEATSIISSKLPKV